MTQAKTVRLVNFLHEVIMFLKCTAMVAKKLLVDDKITASLKQICLLGVVCKVSNKNTLSSETFALLKNVWYQSLNFVL